MRTLLDVFFLPPMAVARVGASDTPIESFHWAEDRTSHGATATVIEPGITLRVNADASLTPYLPKKITFKDEGKDGAPAAIRPTAPFFELWARLQDEDGTEQEEPVTLALLAELGLGLDGVRYRLTAGNRKAARRAGTQSCAFIAEVTAQGDDHEPKELLAISPHSSGEQPLVTADKPIPLGRFQVLRPTKKKTKIGEHEVDLGVLRVRFTPPKGLTYGPATAITGPASPLPPGVYDPQASKYGRIHEIVAPENRILNGNTVWSTGYVMMNGLFEDPTPQDGYDGAGVGNWQAWGCVDDASDGVLEAFMAHGGKRYHAIARVMTGPPDFAPDRRPFYTIADDLADREIEPELVTKDNAKRVWLEIANLFRRAYETVSLLNLDAARTRALQENVLRETGYLHLSGQDSALSPDGPRTDGASMTKDDTSFVDRVQFLTLPQGASLFSASVAPDRLPYTQASHFVHAQMMDEGILLDFLRRRHAHVDKLLRPAFGAVGELSESPSSTPDPHMRDPRVLRDSMNDMRMPPYMRDACFFPLSLTRRQYRELLGFLAYATTTGEQELFDTLYPKPKRATP